MSYCTTALEYSLYLQFHTFVIHANRILGFFKFASRASNTGIHLLIITNVFSQFAVHLIQFHRLLHMVHVARQYGSNGFQCQAAGISVMGRSTVPGVQIIKIDRRSGIVFRSQGFIRVTELFENERLSLGACKPQWMSTAMFHGRNSVKRLMRIFAVRHKL